MYFFPTSRFFRPLTVGLLLAAFTQCTVNETVREKPSSVATSTGAASSRNELKENRAFEQVQFRLDFLDEARLAGQDILFVRSAADLSASQQARLQTALQAGNLPLKLRTRIYARNPGKANVQLKQLDYRLLLDGSELAAGSTGADTPVEPSTIITLPVAVDLNVAPLLTNGATPVSFAAGLANFTREARRLQLLIRPTYVGASGRTLQAPDFVPVELVTVKR